MTGSRRARQGRMAAPTLSIACALALTALAGAPNPASAAPWYDDGAGNGCVSCHTGFENGTGPLHLQHNFNFGITTCNVCHQNGGGSTPVLTYTSGPGGGLGCVGCHGRDYGETSPLSGQPKSTGYGLRALHVAEGVAACGLTPGCHVPGLQGHPAGSLPTPLAENVAPIYFGAAYSDLTDPCDSTQEDFPFDPDALGLDQDGDGARDYPADPDCPMPAVFECGASPMGGCVTPGKGILVVNEKKAGKESLKLVLARLQSSVVASDYGDPVSGDTEYKVCIYDGTETLVTEITVDKATAACGTKPCFKAVSDKGFKYTDKETLEDGALKMVMLGGAAGKGKVVFRAKNKSGNMPTGTAAAMNGGSAATAQLLSSDGACFGADLSDVKKADGLIFKATTP